MSFFRIFVGLLVGCCLLACGLVVAFFFDFPPQLVLLAVVVVALAVYEVCEERNRRKLLQPYWDRGCMGARWRKCFPSDSKAAIREFLNIFVNAFGFKKNQKLCFSPDDRVMDIYHALYPPGCWADCMDLKDLAGSLETRYRIDVCALWRDDITLGQLYEYTRTGEN